MEAVRSVLGFNKPKPCCQRQNIALQRLDVVYRIALAALSFVADAMLFACSFAAGFTLAVTVTLYQVAKFGAERASGMIRPVCGQGYMEYLSGRKFPAWMVHSVTTAFIGAHVLHFPLFFAPFVGLFVGFWAGAETVNGAVSLSRRAVLWVQKKPCCS